MSALRRLAGYSFSCYLVASSSVLQAGPVSSLTDCETPPAHAIIYDGPRGWLAQRLTDNLLILWEGACAHNQTDDATTIANIMALISDLRARPVDLELFDESRMRHYDPHTASFVYEMLRNYNQQVSGE